MLWNVVFYAGGKLGFGFFVCLIGFFGLFGVLGFFSVFFVLFLFWFVSVPWFVCGFYLGFIFLLGLFLAIMEKSLSIKVNQSTMVS